MADERPSDRRARLLNGYVSSRLSSEKTTNGHGYLTRVAEKVGFSRPHVSTVADGKKGVGEDFEEAIAKFWGMTPEDLWAAAEAWARQNPASATPRHEVLERLIAAHPEAFSPDDRTELRAQVFPDGEPTEGGWFVLRDRLKAERERRAAAPPPKLQGPEHIVKGLEHARFESKARRSSPPPPPPAQGKHPPPAAKPATKSKGPKPH